MKVGVKSKKFTRSLSNTAEIGLIEVSAHQKIGNMKMPTTVTAAMSRRICRGREVSITA